MTVLGIDISKWNGNWNAVQAKTAGAAYVFMKSSQATFTDVLFTVNWRKAKDAGLLRGAYHYLDYTKPARDQANYFADLIGSDPGELPPVVDYEQNRTDNSVVTARTYLKDFLEQMKLLGNRCILYTGASFWKTYGETSSYWTHYPLWLAQYTTAAAPTVPEPWMRWIFWQYTSKGDGKAYGSESYNLDMNRFDGTYDDLLAFAGISNPTVNYEGRISSLEQRVAVLEQRLASFTQAGSTTAVSTTTIPAVETPVPSTPPQPATATQAVCLAYGLNVRSGPGTNYPVVSGLVSGQRVTVLERQSGWARFEAPAGWSSDQYLRFS
jgi:GH25 family lysozyme M1 (1,4-beta-N-acetylmuramidase)